jgi:hypothetical protein
MPSLRSLLSDIAPPSTAERKVIYVYDTDFGRPVNSGGACCLFTVPAGASSVTFELWGAGGAASGGNCMYQIKSPGSGGYAIRTVPTVAGCTYTVCAGGTGCACCCSCISNSGCTSFVTGSSIPATCALGGEGGCANCGSWNSTYFISSCIKPTACNKGDLSLSSTVNNVFLHGCYYRINELPTGSAKVGSSINAPDWSCGMCFNGDQRGCSMFPGGGGIAGTPCQCVKGGGAGGAGMVKISYS